MGPSVPSARGAWPYRDVGRSIRRRARGQEWGMTPVLSRGTSVNERAGPPLLLGIDVGSTRTKAMLVDAATGDEVGTGAGDSPFVTSGERTEATVDALVESSAG